MGVEVEVLERRSPLAKSTIPDEIHAWATARGGHLNLISIDPRMIQQERGYGRRPVLFSEIPAELQDTVRVSFDPPEQNYGRLQRGDQLLAIQSIEERDAYRLEAAEQALRMERSVLNEESIKARNEELKSQYGTKGPGGKGLVEIVASGPIPNIRDHVIPGATVLELMEQDAEVAERVRKSGKS